MKSRYSIGIDFGSNAVRVLVLDIINGEVIASSSTGYQRANAGVYTSMKNVDVARQDAYDYIESLTRTFIALKGQKVLTNFDWQRVVGIGVDATGSTPIPITEEVLPLNILPEFKDNLNAMAWMWKDHSSEAEAQNITRLAMEMRPDYLQKCGGKYSSEWFWAKILHCANVAPEVFNAAYTWVEFSDYIPAVLTGVEHANYIKRNKCAAGHKALYNEAWGGYPDKDFLKQLNPALLKVKESLPEKAYAVDTLAGYLSPEWASKFGLREGLPVAMGALDAHVGAIGSGVNKNTLVKIIGTSSCDIIVGSNSAQDIQGVSGVADDSVLPGYLGIEAGQSAVGDLFKWFVGDVLGEDESIHSKLSSSAKEIQPGESGLLALDWNNGNRDVLSDSNLRGLIVGQSLHTKDYEVYRALIEATAFGAKRIIDQLETGGVAIDHIICCGGIPQKNSLLMQIYADVFNRPVFIAESNETVALGAAMIGAIAYSKVTNMDYTLEDLQKICCKVNQVKYVPIDLNVNTYEKLYEIYLQLHDAFGTLDGSTNLYNVMKQLIQIKNGIF
ncbi:ribulokinase [Carboxylicivirga taeanensis]|uniref:ribulokinase n=1 Tax=Carboxylicivirga taeanensis TaxID=1416875 RepID=UPI003F6DB845